MPWYHCFAGRELLCNSFTVIMVTMGYKHIGTVYNKKNQIAKKLHVNNLDDFVRRYNNPSDTTAKPKERDLP